MEKSQIRAARAMLEWSQETLAQKSGVSLPTIKRIEPGNGKPSARDETLNKIRDAFEQENIVFQDNPIGVGLKFQPIVSHEWVLGKGRVLVRETPYDAPVALLPKDALVEAEKAKNSGDAAFAKALSEAAHAAQGIQSD